MNNHSRKKMKIKKNEETEKEKNKIKKDIEKSQVQDTTDISKTCRISR